MSTATWLLAIDIGTSNTAAAHTNPAGAIEALPLTHTGNTMSSALFVATADEILVGAAAHNRAASAPRAFIGTPKRILGNSTDAFEVSGDSIALATLFAAIVRSVLDRGRGLHDGTDPDAVLLTHPEAWVPAQVGVLREAAILAGVDEAKLHTLSEPVAAAHHYAHSDAAQDQSQVAVFDFGAGTLDIAALRRTDDGFIVVATRGNAGLGGRTFDAAIRQWAHDQIAEDDPEFADTLDSVEIAQRLRNETAISEAKELLSTSTSASITLTGTHGRTHSVTLTRDEFDDASDHIVDRSVRLAQEVVDAAAGGSIDVLYLTGGAAQIPLVHSRLRSIAPVATLDDPKTVVAQGAIAAHRAQQAPRRTTSHAQTPNGADPIDPAGFAPSITQTIATRRRWRGWLIVAVAAVLVVAAAIAVPRLLSSDEGGADLAAQPVPVAERGPATTEEQVLEGLPIPLAGVLQDCSRSTFTRNDGVEFQCRISADETLLEEITRATDHVLVRVAVDPQEAERRVISDRAQAPQRENAELVENGNRTATAVLTQPGEGLGTDLRYANSTTGVLLSMDSFQDADAAKAFLSRSGLFS